MEGTRWEKESSVFISCPGMWSFLGWSWRKEMTYGSPEPLWLVRKLPKARTWCLRGSQGEGAGELGSWGAGADKDLEGKLVPPQVRLRNLEVKWCLNRQDSSQQLSYVPGSSRGKVPASPSCLSSDLGHSPIFPASSWLYHFFYGVLLSTSSLGNSVTIMLGLTWSVCLVLCFCCKVTVCSFWFLPWT